LAWKPKTRQKLNSLSKKACGQRFRLIFNEKQISFEHEKFPSFSFVLLLILDHYKSRSLPHSRPFDSESPGKVTPEKHLEICKGKMTKKSFSEKFSHRKKLIKSSPSLKTKTQKVFSFT
jgi:hypothetical protein